MFRKIVYELRYSDTFPQRLSVATASTLYGVFSLITAWAWGLGTLFLLAGILGWWRIFDQRPRLIWGTLVNLYAAVLWVSITSANVLHGQTLSDNVGEIMLSLTSLFVLTRTDLTIIDKGSA